MLQITLVAAVAENGVIGTGHGGLPWHLPDEAADYRAYIQGKWLLLGRTTLLEMKGCFTTSQQVLVLSQSGVDVSAYTSPAPTEVVDSVEMAIALAKKAEVRELVVLGGAKVYQAALPFATHMRLSMIKGNYPGHVFFPQWPSAQWLCQKERVHAEWALREWERVSS